MDATPPVDSGLRGRPLPPPRLRSLPPPQPHLVASPMPPPPASDLVVVGAPGGAASPGWGVSSKPPHPTLPLQAAVGAMVVLSASLVLAKVLVDQLVELAWPIAVYVALLSLVGYGPSLLWCSYVSRRWGTGHLWRDLDVRPHVEDVGWGPVVWLAAIGCQIVAGVLVEALGIPLSSNTEGLDDLAADRTYVIAIVVAAVVAAPVVEEIVFRGVVLRGLRSRLPAGWAVAVQAVLFGVAHADPVRGVGNVGLVLVLSAVGAALGTAAYVLRRLAASMIAHAILNGVVLAIVLSGVADTLREQARL